MSATAVYQLVSVCCICKRMVVDGQPIGERVAPAENQSHGVCIQCLPDYGRSMGLSQAQIEGIIRAEVERLNAKG